MRCPFCGHDDTQVKDSRPSEDNSAIRRRRYCPGCGARFTTFERIQLRELTVLKSTGRKEPFDRDKLVRSLQVSLRKRDVEEAAVDRLVNAMVRQLESSGESEVPSKVIGEMVMNALKTLDGVAYVRYASVYKDFRAPEEFNEFVGTLSTASSGEAPTESPGHPGRDADKPS